MMKSILWPRLIVSIALVKIVGALGLWAAAGFHSETQGAFEIQTWHLAGFALVMALVGSALVLPLARDPRAVFLGGFFLVAAAAFTDSPLEMARWSLSPGGLHLLRVLWWLQPVCFMPFFLWAFLREFPRRPRVARTYYHLDRIVRLLAWGGAALFVLNALAGLLWTETDKACDAFAPLLGWALRGCELRKDLEIFSKLLLAPALASLILLAVRGFRAEGDDRRRVGLFALALLLGVGPMAATALLEVFPPYQDAIQRSEALRLGLLVFGSFCLLSLPFTLTYSVLVHRVLEFHILARRALRYALARGSVSAIVALPLGALGWYLHERRDEALTQIVSGPRFLLLTVAALLGIRALKYRTRLLEAVDRHFFREQYDARNVLTSLTERIPRAGSAGELADLILPGIERALHPEILFLLAEDRSRSALVATSQAQRQLDLSSALARMIADHGRPFVLDLEDPRSAAVRLPAQDRQWVRETGIRLCVPIVAIDGTLLAAIALSGKKSGAPYSSEDRRLLSAIAGSAAPILELHRIRRTAATALPAASAGTPREPGDLDNARECPQCGQVFLPQTVFCVTCDRRLETAAVPYSIPGKLCFERRIGAGGMGVVYRAADLALGRGVAVKTLRHVSSEQAMKLRREARTAAAVAHQHLAAIYGVETWHGMPMLILELLEGGMLAQRLAQSPLSPAEALDLGICLADALAQLHAADILHRDIKPSNIGYARDGKPKLTDFGIARFIYDLDREALTTLPVSIWNLPLTEESAEKLRGTLPYLSPEAVEGQPPDVSFDLWSLSIVLYESLIGRKLFTGQSPKQMMTRILLARLPDLRQSLPDAPPLLVDLFRELLHKDRRQRPGSAAEMRALLEATREGFAA